MQGTLQNTITNTADEDAWSDQRFTPTRIKPHEDSAQIDSTTGKYHKALSGTIRIAAIPPGCDQMQHEPPRRQC